MGRIPTFTKWDVYRAIQRNRYINQRGIMRLLGCSVEDQVYAKISVLKREGEVFYNPKHKGLETLRQRLDEKEPIFRQWSKYGSELYERNKRSL